jgi:hypothetical protein
MPLSPACTSIRVEVGTMKALVVAVLSLALLAVPATLTQAANSRYPAYHWPIKPFNQQHPIRGAFGDPRIVTAGQPFGLTGPDRPGGHSFHNGVDIAAATGTPVYPVVSGVVVRNKPGQIVVHTRDGRSFQYYHLTAAPSVRVGRTVVAGHTVLGWIRSTYQHVHLAEIDGSVIHNPLDPGHLEPYRDWTRPSAIALYTHVGPGAKLLENHAVGPGDELAVAAADPPVISAPGSWYGLPQTPALVEWRLFRGTVGTPWRIAVDFRHTQPPARYFWNVYGAGTYQNCPTFADHIYHGTRGRYLFRLHIHPDRLQPGPYRLAVRVTDTHGNRSTTRWPLVVTD